MFRTRAAFALTTFWVFFQKTRRYKFFHSVGSPGSTQFKRSVSTIRMLSRSKSFAANYLSKSGLFVIIALGTSRP